MLVAWYLSSVSNLVQTSFVPDVRLMTSCELTSAFDFWSLGKFVNFWVPPDRLDSCQVIRIWIFLSLGSKVYSHSQNSVRCIVPKLHHFTRMILGIIRVNFGETTRPVGADVSRPLGRLRLQSGVSIHSSILTLLRNNVNMMAAVRGSYSSLSVLASHCVCRRLHAPANGQAIPITHQLNCTTHVYLPSTPQFISTTYSSDCIRLALTFRKSNPSCCCFTESPGSFIIQIILYFWMTFLYLLNTQLMQHNIDLDQFS